MINDHDVTTNFGVKIGDSVDHAINYLGDNYRKDKVGKGYDALIYVDKEHHMKLSILYKDNVVKRIEFLVVKSDTFTLQNKLLFDKIEIIQLRK